MIGPRPAFSALPAAASPATDLFRAASGALSANYYGWSETDRPALISRYAATLDAQCAPHADACTFDQGRAVVREMLLQLHDPHTNVRDAEGAERLREIQDDLTVPRTGVRAGHALTNRLLRALFARPDAFEMVDCGLPTGQKLPGVGVVRADVPEHA